VSKSRDYKYKTTGSNYLPLDEWKEWSIEYYKKEVNKENKRLSAKIDRYQLLTKDMKYDGITKAIKKIK